MTCAGASVFKVNLNGGDWLFYPRDAIAFRGRAGAWPEFLKGLVERLDIDTVILFGDCRAYHVVAREVCRGLGLEICVFEEGYLRPDYVTLEREGVNGYSTLPNNPIFYLNHISTRTVRRDVVGPTFRYAAMWAMLYYMAANLLRPFFLHYRHHRPLHVLEGLFWVRSFWRKALYKTRERQAQSLLTGPLSGKYFLVPLQVHTDAQIRVHAAGLSIDRFIFDVVSSFARHAPQEKVLVFKHHPMDRGYSDYSKLMQKLRTEFGLGSRLMYIHDQHLPSLLDHACGAIVINSTVGLSAIYHNTPLKVCGDAIYDMKGLTYQSSLQDFWRDGPGMMVDRRLFHNFRSYIIEKTQFNGSFYKRLPIKDSFSGMHWEERWLPGDNDRRRFPRELPAALSDCAEEAKEEGRGRKRRRKV